MNGPFAIVVANSFGIVGFTDRIKLRPLVAAKCGDRLYLSSEEALFARWSPGWSGSSCRKPASR